MSAEQPVSVTRARQLLAVLVALGAVVTVLIVLLQDQLIKSWAEGRPDTRKVLRSQGLDAVKDGEVHVPAFIPVALVLFVVVALLIWVLAAFLRGGYGWARMSLTVTRPAPRRKSGCAGADLRPRRKGRAASRHPARRATDLTAGLLARGSPPVTAFPGTIPVALWHELAADSCGGSCGFGPGRPAPHSLFTLRREETVNSRSINGLGPALSMRARIGAICGAV